MTDKTILHVENLKVIFPNPAGVVRAVEGVSLSVREGECAAIVGESGSGKSVTSLAVMKLLSTPPAVMRVDRLEFDGRDLRDASENEMLDIRGQEMAMIFQDALTALNPVMTIGRQLDEVFIRHRS
ncbi:MAG: ATP-binding cassette domain-containing protein, partial [Oscillospiraceae bacterium]|nr:ATP-binding cassette domain-containing protein [Oscillospiraceae bacterium]